MSERISMNISTPATVPMEPTTPAPIRAAVPNGAVYVTLDELMAILANYVSRSELENEPTIVRWGTGE